MLCYQCNNSVEPDFNFCPNCGASINPTTTDKAAGSPHIIQKKKMPIWFKLTALIAVLALVGVTAGILFTESWVDVVDHQLKALQNNDIDKAYFDYTSKEFQAATSIDQFRNFIETYPIFVDNQSSHFSKRSIDRNIRTLKGHLTSNEHVNTPIEYKLIQDDGKWKILSIRLIKPKHVSNPHAANHPENLLEIVKGQLEDLQNKKVDAAYTSYSSLEFKETTSSEAFTQFIAHYPILTEHHIVSFHKPSVKNGIGTLSVVVQSDRVAAYIKYYLIFENKQWKIWSMRILSPSKNNQNEMDAPTEEGKPDIEPMSLGEIRLSDISNDNRRNQPPRQTFPPSLKDLYVEIEIKNGVKGNIVNLNLNHIQSQSFIPAQTVIEEGGDSMLLSHFSPPSSGWPTGPYKLEVSTSSGLHKVVSFSVE